MTRHEWHEATSGDDKRYYRATHHAGRWKFETTLASEEEWHSADPPDRDFLQGLREVLWRKYQRGRVPHRLLVEIDEMIEDLAAAPTDSAEDSAS